MSIKKHSNEFINDLILIVDDFKKQELSKFWKPALKQLKEKYPETYMTTDSIRWLYNRYSSDQQEIRKYRTEMLDLEDGLETLGERIMKRMKKRTELHWLAEYLNVSLEEILAEISLLQANGYNVRIWKEGKNKLFAKSLPIVKEQFENLDLYDEDLTEVTFAVLGDTHLGSEYSAEDELNDAYDIIESRGITQVFHGGDLSEGWKSFRHETFLNNKAIGFQNQLEYIVEHYPKRDGVTTYFIEGNHDLWVGKDALASLGKTVSMVRSDLKYLGAEFARINLTPYVDLTLYHPNDGSSANVFSKLQNFIDRGGQKVSVLNFIFHYHKVGMLQHRGVYGFYGSSFQRQSNWMNINNLSSYIGFWIITLKLNAKGELIRMIPEYISYDKVKKPN